MVYRKTANMRSVPRSPPRDLPKELREVSVVHFTDPTAVGDSIDVLEQDIVSLTGRFEAKRVSVPLEECCLMYQWTNARLRTRTQVHSDFDACSVLGPKAHGSIDGTELHPYSMIAAGHAQICFENGECFSVAPWELSIPVSD